MNQKKIETMIYIFKHRKGQTYKQIKLAKKGIFLFTCFNPFSPNSDQHQFSPNNIHMLPREMVRRVNKMITKEKML